MAKENKTSEFRQAWIQDLRNALAEFSASLSTVKHKVTGEEKVNEKEKQKVNRLLSEINLRINYVNQSPEERELSSAITKMQDDAYDKTSDFASAQASFTKASSYVLKKEWVRVKRGELIYRLCMYPCLAITGVATVLSIVYIYNHFSCILALVIN